MNERVFVKKGSRCKRKLDSVLAIASIAALSSSKRKRIRQLKNPFGSSELWSGEKVSTGFSIIFPVYFFFQNKKILFFCVEGKKIFFLRPRGWSEWDFMKDTMSNNHWIDVFDRSLVDIRSRKWGFLLFSTPNSRLNGRVRKCKDSSKMAADRRVTSAI